MVALFERIVRHARQMKRVRRPLFPGYLFINFDIDTASGVTSTVLSASKALLALEHAIRGQQ